MACCEPCNRYFESPLALRQHLRDSDQHDGMYCRRCNRYFKTDEAAEQHIRDSSSHHTCHLYHARSSRTPDYSTRSELVHHWKNEHNYCVSCDSAFINQYELDEHDVDYHFKCLTCGSFYRSRSNLLNHKKTHQIKTVDCPGSGCERTFISNSAMVLHLETNNCPSDITSGDIWTIACEYSSEYLTNAKNAFQCPTCGVSFGVMSALLQHAESESCDEDPRCGLMAGFVLYFKNKFREERNFVPMFRYPSYSSDSDYEGIFDL